MIKDSIPFNSDLQIDYSHHYQSSISLSSSAAATSKHLNDTH